VSSACGMHSMHVACACVVYTIVIVWGSNMVIVGLNVYARARVFINVRVCSCGYVFTHTRVGHYVTEGYTSDSVLFIQ